MIRLRAAGNCLGAAKSSPRVVEEPRDACTIFWEPRNAWKTALGDSFGRAGRCEKLSESCREDLPGAAGTCQGAAWNCQDLAGSCLGAAWELPGPGWELPGSCRDLAGSCLGPAGTWLGAAWELPGPGWENLGKTLEELPGETSKNPRPREAP